MCCWIFRFWNWYCLMTACLLFSIPDAAVKTHLSLHFTPTALSFIGSPYCLWEQICLAKLIIHQIFSVISKFTSEILKSIKQWRWQKMTESQIMQELKAYCQIMFNGSITRTLFFCLCWSTLSVLPQPHVMTGCNTCHYT